MQGRLMTFLNSALLAQEAMLQSLPGVLELSSVPTFADIPLQVMPFSAQQSREALCLRIIEGVN